MSDLAMGKPGANVGSIADAGSVTVVYGTSTSLTATGAQIWTQGSPGIYDVAEEYDRFGRALVAEDFNGDGYYDLAVGVPYEDVGLLNDAGAVNALFSAGAGGLSSTGDQIFHQGSNGLQDTAEAYDSFGFGL